MSALRDAAQQTLEALEPYADIKPRDWKTDREKLWRSYDALRAALAAPCEMGAMCLNCQPRGPNGECPDAAPQPAAVPAEDAIEAAYWDFDARHKGYGPHKTMPQSERDAFKWAVRAMLAAAARKGE